MNPSQSLIESAVYCSTCLVLVRDLNFLQKSIDAFQRRLSSSREGLESLLKAHYRRVLQETVNLDPLSDVKISPSDTFVKTLGETLCFDVGTEQNIFSPVEVLIPEVDPGPNQLRRSRRARRVKVKDITIYRPILPKPTTEEHPEIDSEPDSDGGGDHGFKDDPDFDPKPYGYAEEIKTRNAASTSRELKPNKICSKTRLRALISRQRKLRQEGRSDLSSLKSQSKSR